jgi:23S rRNA (adenine2503-C2)-methyltransferase
MTVSLSLIDLSKDQLADLLAGWGEPRYRAGQIWDWLYKKLATDPAEMTNLPQGLRDHLAAEMHVNPLEQVYEQHSGDQQTIKWLFRLPDRVTIETVLMLYLPDEGLRDETLVSTQERRTVCISTQAGCAMGCVFCATGQAGLARNLTAGEIVAQVLAAARWLRDSSAQTPRLRMMVEEERLSNVVVMGMGEPFANYERTWEALRRITDPAGFGLGARRITVSTVGLPHGIRRMAEEPLQVNLAVSLHAPNDELRSRLAPINRRYPIAEVIAAVHDYVAKTNRRVTFEYALMNGVNDSPMIARELAALLSGRPGRSLKTRQVSTRMLCHVNLILLNPVVESPYQPSTPEAAAAFQGILERAGIPATLRVRRGIDIDAGCGQLRRRVSDAER